MEKKLSIISHKKAKSLVEKTAAMIFRGCAIISVLAVVTTMISIPVTRST